MIIIILELDRVSLLLSLKSRAMIKYKVQGQAIRNLDIRRNFGLDLDFNNMRRIYVLGFSV